MTPIDWKLDKVQWHTDPEIHRHHSLVTPIDWKPAMAVPLRVWASRHHSLVTPIDWKLGVEAQRERAKRGSHHSLVTPIDWKLERMSVQRFSLAPVTTRW